MGSSPVANPKKFPEIHPDALPDGKLVTNAPEVMNPYADPGMFKGDVCEAGDPVSELLEKHEEKSIITSGDFESVNLGSDDDPKLVHIGKALSTSEKQAFTSFLKDRVHCFAFSYEDMPGLDSNLVEHKLPIKPGAQPVKARSLPEAKVRKRLLTLRLLQLRLNHHCHLSSNRQKPFDKFQTSSNPIKRICQSLASFLLPNHQKLSHYCNE